MQKIFVFIFVLLLFSCDNENTFDCIKKTGDIVEIEEFLEDFENIYIDDLFELNIKQDTINKIVVQGGKNLMPKMYYEVKDGTLYIEDHNTCNWVRTYNNKFRITLSAKNIKYIEIYGQVTLNSIDTLRYNELKIQVKSKAAKADLKLDTYMSNFQVWDGTGEFKLSGKTYHNWVYSDGTGFVFAKDLISRMAHIENRSTGDIEVNACQELDATIRGPGNILYYGEPDTVFISDQRSTGKLINISE